MGTTGQNYGVNFFLVRDGKVLLQLRDENCERHPLAWCVPGGGMGPEDNGSYIATVIREVYEEYGIKLLPSDCTFLGERTIGDPGEFFICHIPHGQEPELREGKAMAFVSITELATMKMGFDHDKFIVPTLINYLDTHPEWAAVAEHVPELRQFKVI